MRRLLNVVACDGVIIDRAAGPAPLLRPPPGTSQEESSHLGSSAAAALGGYPLATVPMGSWQRLPLGLTFIGKRFVYYAPTIYLVANSIL
eukprot:SAG11_NODE_5935_length_1430_cov_1.070624_2_plen_90_part_00